MTSQLQRHLATHRLCGVRNGRVVQSLSRVWLMAGALTIGAQQAFAEVIMEVDDNVATPVGTWSPSAGIAGFYGSDYAFAEGGGSADSLRFFSPRPITATGSWCIQAHWVAASNRSTTAQYQVYDGTTLRNTFTANQQVNGGAWRRLGCVTLTRGLTAEVRLTDTGSAAGAIVVGDGVRWVWEEPVPAAAPLDFCIALNGGFGPGLSGQTFFAKGLGGVPAANSCKPFNGGFRAASSVHGTTTGTICRSKDGKLITATLHSTAPQYIGPAPVANHIEYCPTGTTGCTAIGAVSTDNTGWFSGPAAPVACTQGVTDIPSVHN